MCLRQAEPAGFENSLSVGRKISYSNCSEYYILSEILTLS